MSLKTFQDFENAPNKSAFILDAISEYKGSAMYRTAVDADEYDHQRNSTILNFYRTILSSTGIPMVDVTASNNKITSNFFHRLNTQRVTYSLGNGVTFPDGTIKEKLGASFDTRLKQAGYFAQIHGVAYCFWNLDRLHVFKATEFVPLVDESTGALVAGIRFWQLAIDKPLSVVLYEADGYTKYRKDKDGLSVTQEKKAYKLTVKKSPADGEEVVGEENYSSLPIVPLWGSDLRQSTLVGMKSGIDSYDLIRSGFANDLSDVSQIYWIINNAGGMDEEAKRKFREDLLFRHIATANSDDGVDIKPHTQEVPYQARSAYLDRIREGIYEDFGGLDVSAVSAANPTATAINAAYQPLDENADDFEYQVIECVQQLLALQGIENVGATPTFKRNRISNQKEQVEIIMLEAPYLDDETILNKLPNISTDEIEEIRRRKEDESTRAFGTQTEE